MLKQEENQGNNKPVPKSQMESLDIPPIPTLTPENWGLSIKWIKSFRKVLMDHAIKYKKYSIGGKRLSNEDRDSIYANYGTIDEFLRLSKKAFSDKQKARGLD